MNATEVTWSQILPIWWAFFWRSTLMGGIAGFAAGAVAGVLVYTVTGTNEHSGVAGGIAGFVVGVPISIWAFREAVIKRRAELSALLSHTAHPADAA